jgi:hypothetical protein
LGIFGPYGFGAFCSQNNEDFLPSIVVQIARDEPLNTFSNVIGEGYFCSW